MNTTFWGPDGWKLLHTIAYIYPTKPTITDKKTYTLFYKILPKVLPCKYCRDSLVGFMKDLPIGPYLATREKLTMWIYLIHNKVNEKLRCQGFLDKADPSKSTVDKLYSEYIEYIKNNKHLIGAKFIYSVIYNFPTLMKNTKTTISTLTKFLKYLAVVYPDCQFKRNLTFSTNCDKQLEIMLGVECVLVNDGSCSTRMRNTKKLVADNQVKQCKKTCRKN